MLNIFSLKDEDKGRWVIYTGGVGETQKGKIKSWNDTWIFVVYHCADEWDNYQDYTAAATEPSDLKFEIPKAGENIVVEDKLDRFEIMDL